VSFARENRSDELVAGERLRIMEGEEERSARVALCTQSGGSARSAHAREFRGGAVASADLHDDGFGGVPLEGNQADIWGPRRCKRGHEALG
jgi:cytochrome c5